MARGGKVDAKGRSKGGEHHVRVYDYVTATDAWHHATGNAIKGLLYIASFDFGDNNGNIHMSERRLAEGIRVDRKTARKVLVELQAKGFIACTARGSFKAKASPASQWRLTWRSWPARSQGPTNEYRQWQPSKKARGEKFPRTGGKIPQSASIEATTGGEIPPLEEADSQKTAKPHVGKTGPLIVTSAGGDPVELIRVSISDWWRLANAKDRVKLAKQHGLGVNELIDFIAGGDLPFPKLVAIRATIKPARAAA